jgi:hypothetical protein
MEVKVLEAIDIFKKISEFQLKTLDSHLKDQL